MMNMVALSLVVITTLSSLGIAIWSWHAMTDVADELRDFAGFDGMDYDE